MNILIHQFQPGGAVVDEAALEQFQTQWATYRKVVVVDALSHRAVSRMLHDELNRTFPTPFAFLDIACGDASQVARALPGTRARHYHGVDLSRPALELAAANLQDMSFEVELDHRDFVEAMNDRPEPADAAWCSLSIHHLETEGKLRLLRAIRACTSTMLMIYEPTLQDRETRDEYLERTRRIMRPALTMLTPEEWAQIDHHVTTCDFPETSNGWLQLGREAGFTSAGELFTDPNRFFRLFRFDC